VYRSFSQRNRPRKEEREREREYEARAFPLALLFSNARSLSFFYLENKANKRTNKRRVFTKNTTRKWFYRRGGEMKEE